MNEQQQQDDLGRVRASLEVARRRGRFYEPVPADVLGALLAVVDATSWFVGDLESLVAALEPFTPAEEDDGFGYHPGGCRCGGVTCAEPEPEPEQVGGRAFNERMQERERARVLADLGIEVVDLPVSDAVSSVAGGRPVSRSGAENGPQILSRPASLVDRVEARERLLDATDSVESMTERLEARDALVSLLAELEQAERERDVARRGMKAVSRTLGEAEARLARVPVGAPAVRSEAEHRERFRCAYRRGELT